LNSKDHALTVARALDSAKARDIAILDVSEISGFADYFVIATGTSARHVRTLAERTLEALHHPGRKRKHVEGMEACRWVLVDDFDVVVHLFQEEAREFYGLERLWDEAQSVALPASAAAAR
jgi:ribosome-associated protein